MQGEVAAAMVQKVHFAAAVAGTTDTGGAGIGTTVAGAAANVATSGIRQHGAPSHKMRSMHQLLFDMHAGGASDTVGKPGTPNSLHRADPSPQMTAFVEGTSGSGVPRQHTPSLNYLSFASTAAYPAGHDRGASVPDH